MPRCFPDQERDLGRSGKPLVIECRVCGKTKRIHSSASFNSQTCEACLPENDDPELQRLLRDEAFRRGVNKVGAA